MIPSWVEKYVGLPFEIYNCWQLICLVYKKEFNTLIPTYENEYDDALDKEKISKIYARELKLWVKTDVPKPPDIVVCRVKGQPWHAGIMLDEGTMLHTLKHVNAIVEHYDRFVWKNRVLGFWRYYNWS